MGQHCIICNFPCDDDVLFCPECVEADKFNERKTVNDEVVMINDKHITITSGKKAEAKEIYEKIKKRLFLDNLQI